MVGVWGREGDDERKNKKWLRGQEDSGTSYDALVAPLGLEDDEGRGILGGAEGKQKVHGGGGSASFESTSL